MIDYSVTSKKYLIDDGKPMTQSTAYLALRREGFEHKEAGLLLRAARRCAEIDHRVGAQPPSDSPATLAVLVAALVMEWDRQQNLRRAERWIRANLRPARRRVSVYGMKHDCDHAYQRVGSACYLREADFAECLRRRGYGVRNGYVYAKEITPGSTAAT